MRGRSFGFILLLALAGPAKAFEGFTPTETSQLSGSRTEFQGVFEGVKYSYLLDGDGQVLNGSIDGPLADGSTAMDDPDQWVVTADRDKMDDSVSWYAHHYQTGLMLRLTPNGNIQTICLVGSDFPNRPIAVRVGAAPAINFPEDCSSARAATLKSQLLKGGRLLTRGYKWPYDFPEDREGRADNFDKLLRLYTWLRSRPR